MNLKEVVKRFQSKLGSIKCLLFDVDGVLTDGRIFYMGDEVGWNRFFHVRDGYGLSSLIQMGLKVGIISGGDSVGLKKRFLENLKLDKNLLFFGNEDKREAYLRVKESCGLRDEEILYMGDELFDIPILVKAGFSATVQEAGMEVKDVCDYVAKTPAGMGAAREVMDLVRLAKGLNVSIPLFE